ncbi:MAG TPA: transglycosylase SLT domain-containing protein, partial [Trueperaceae bacterium]|nr:transglycosylase SLT domain-containing protein [Trueperaceae bacterium]
RTLEVPASDYEPLSGWGLLVLARLAPLVANIEEAATAYDVPADLLLRVLINESYLDPLAVGPTGDLGLAQVTTDALTLIKALSTDPLSPYANPSLFAGTFSAFDPDFSVCAGAVKLAWARSQPGGNDEHIAYARYINPLEGVVRGKVSDRHAALVAAITDLEPLAHSLEATISAYRADPTSIADKERALLGVTNLVADGKITVAQAYFVTAGLVESFEIADLPFYDAIRHELYGDDGATPEPHTGGDVG